MGAPQAHQNERGTAGNHGEGSQARRGSLLTVRQGQPSKRLQMIAASQTEDSGTVVTGRLSRLAPVDGAGSVVEAGGGTARHTRA